MKKNFSKKILALALISSLTLTNFGIANAIYGSAGNSPRIENFIKKVGGNDTNRKNVNILAREVEYNDETILKCQTVDKPLGNAFSSYPNFTSVSFYDENENRVEVNLNLGENISAPLKIGENNLRVHTQVQGYCLVEDVENGFTYNIDDNTSEITLNFAKINFVKVETDKQNTELELHRILYDKKGLVELDENLEIKTEKLKSVNTGNSTDYIFKDLADGTYLVKNKTTSKEKTFTLDLQNKNPDPNEPFQIIEFLTEDAEKTNIILPEKVKLPAFLGDEIFHYLLADLGTIEINGEDISSSNLKKFLIEKYLKDKFFEKNPSLALDKITPYYFLGNFDLVFPDGSSKEYDFSEIFEMGDFTKITKDLPEKIENTPTLVEFTYENISKDSDSNLPYIWLSSEDTCSTSEDISKTLVQNIISVGDKKFLYIIKNPETNKYALNPSFYDYSKVNLNIDFSNSIPVDFDLNLEDINGKYICIGQKDGLGFLSTFAQSKNKINLDGKIDNSNNPKPSPTTNTIDLSQNNNYLGTAAKIGEINDDPRVSLKNQNIFSENNSTETISSENKTEDKKSENIKNIFERIENLEKITKENNDEIKLKEKNNFSLKVENEEDKIKKAKEKKELIIKKFREKQKREKL